MVKGAKSLSGLRGNLYFLTHYKVWATLVVFFVGVAVGFLGGLGFG